MRTNAFDRYEDYDENLGFSPQGNIYGIKALGFFCLCPDSEADLLGLTQKDGWAQRGSNPQHRDARNEKRRGRKTLTKRARKMEQHAKYGFFAN